MCMMCPDAVEFCRDDSCRIAGRLSRVFYLGDTLCPHLEERYGTNNASLLAHVRADHDGGCIDTPCEYLDYDTSPAELLRVNTAVAKERESND